ncbi:MAG: SAM-dependent methyltransferase, partial [Gammaproteobacteria bacterium]|nr:SAM-dependent methyltransferase [Gammaproteobacteria bacterium]
PRDMFKFVTTARSALESLGIAEPQKHMAIIRSWRTSTLLVKSQPFTDVDIAAIKTFSADRSFDVVYFPGISESDVNRYNLLDEPLYYNGVQALLGKDTDAFAQRYKFDIRPATDNRPYFFHFFKWRALRELLTLRNKGGMALFDFGYPVLIAALAQAVIASLFLILLPLWFLPRPENTANAGTLSPLRMWGYFFAVGMAFMLVEIAFIQKFILFLSHPLYAVAVVLSGFLLFSGLGSRYAQKSVTAAQQRRWIIRAVSVIAIVGLTYLALLPWLAAWLLQLPPVMKISVGLILIAPLAFAMGLPFPLGLTQISITSPHWIPWAWGVNGCASVVGVILASILAMHFGFAAVVVLAIFMYAAAATLLCLRRSV